MKRTTIALMSMIIVMTLVSLISWSMVPVQAEPVAIDLDRISEQTGYLATTEPLTDDCVFDERYEVYLCEMPRATVRVPAAPEARAEALALAQTGGILLVPDILTRNVMAFNAITGDLVDAAFIEMDEDATGTPVHAIISPNNRVLVSDQTRNVVHQYNLDGNYLGIFAPAGGANPEIMENIRGMALRPNGNLLVTVYEWDNANGFNANSVVEFDTDGVFVGTFVTAGAGGLNAPFDVYLRDNVDWLVSSSLTDQILRYGLDTGDFIAELAPVNDFPQQIAQAANGNVLVANYAGAQEGIVELTPEGALVGVYNPAELGQYRGVYELPNNNLLVSTSAGVYEINRAGELVSTKYTGYPRFIELMMLQAPDAFVFYLPMMFR